MRIELVTIRDEHVAFATIPDNSGMPSAVRWGDQYFFYDCLPSRQPIHDPPQYRDGVVHILPDDDVVTANG